MTRGPSRTITPSPAWADETRFPASARPHRAGMRRRMALLCAIVSAALLAGCGSDDTDDPTGSEASSTSTSASYSAEKQALCEARDQLQTSIAALTDPDLLSQGVVAIDDAVDQVQTDLQSVEAAAKQDYQPQLEALKASLRDVKEAAGQVGEGSPGPAMTALGTALTGLGEDASALLADLQATCS